jgi:hypothetical protein
MLMREAEMVCGWKRGMRCRSLALEFDMSKWERRKRSSKWKLTMLATIGALFMALCTWVVRAGLGGYPEAKERSTETWARMIRTAIQNWQGAHNTIACPTIQQLIDERYLARETSALDSWKHPFELRCKQSEVYVYSLGRDGKRGTQDDILIPTQRLLETSESNP